MLITGSVIDLVSIIFDCCLDDELCIGSPVINGNNVAEGRVTGGLVSSPKPVYPNAIWMHPFVALHTQDVS